MPHDNLIRPGILYYDDVAVGDRLPQITRGPYSVMELDKFGAMIGDFYPGHRDHKWATEVDGVPGVVVFGLLNMVHMAQIVTDWMGSAGTLKKFAHRSLSQVYAGDIVIIRGEVTAKHRDGAAHQVECRLWGEKQNGTSVEDGSALVWLPSRAGQVAENNDGAG